MPQALPFLAAAAVPAAYATVAYIATSVLVGVYQYDRAKSKARAARAALQGDSRSLTIRSAIAPRQLVLGTTRVPGILHYAEFVGSEEQYFDIVLAVSHNQLASVDGVYVGQEFIAAANIVSQVPTTGTYATQATLTATEWFGSSGINITLQHAPVNAGAVKVTANVGTVVDPISVELSVATVVGNVVTLTAAPVGSVTVDYSYLSDPALKLQWVLGTSSQAAMAWSGLSTPKWGTNHRLLGMGALRVLHLAEHSLFASGFPDISLLATGPVHVWDPRASGGAGAYIETGTSNPALLAAWYRTLPKADGGMGIPSTWIDWPSVAAAANICDELITVKTLDGASTEQVKRYECHIVLKLAGVTRADNLRAILNCMAGDFPFTGGLYRCFAGAYRAPVFTITDEDVSGDEPLTFTPASGGFKKPPNAIAANIFDKAKLYAEVGAPEVANATYLALDGAEEMEEIALPGVTDARQANYLMGVALERSRPRMAGQFTGGGKLRNATLLDAVQFSLDNYPELAGRVFEIRRWGNDFKGNHPVQVREVEANDWTLDPNTYNPVSQPTPPDLSYLLVVSDIAGLDATSGDTERAVLHDGTVINRIKVTWTQHAQAYVRETGRIEVRWKRGSATSWVDEPALPGSATTAYLLPVADGELYIVQVRAVNGRGAYCKWAQVLEVAANVTGAQGSAGLVLVAHGVANALLVRGRTVLKTGGTAAWDAAVRSETAITGGCEVSFRSIAGGVMVGLNTDAATDGGYTGIDYAVYIENSSNAQIYESGSLVVTTIAAAFGDAWSVRYTGAAVEYRRNGSLVRVVKAAIGKVFYLDSSFYTPGLSAVEQLQFVPLAAKAVEYKASSYGSSASLPGGFQVGLRHVDAGVDEISIARSYNFARISVATGLVTFTQTYDVYGNGAFSSGRNAATLAADLDATGNDSYVVVIGHDEPQGLRLTGGLEAAMYRCGASPRVFGAPGFKFRAAYMLIGRGNIGTGKGYEAYRGEVDSDTNAYLQVAFQITQAGLLLVDGQPFSGLLEGAVTEDAVDAGGGFIQPGVGATVTITDASVSYVNPTGRAISVQIICAVDFAYSIRAANATGTPRYYVTIGGAASGNGDFDVLRYGVISDVSYPSREHFAETRTVNAGGTLTVDLKLTCTAKTGIAVEDTPQVGSETTRLSLRAHKA